MAGTLTKLIDELRRLPADDSERRTRLLDRIADVALASEIDLVRLRREVAALRADATHDPLTGLLNRRGFDHALESAIAASNRTDNGGVLVMIDLDGFKPVNDTFGHAAGDEVLRRVAQVLRSNVRLTDSVARIGGDEFAVIFTNTDREDGLARAEALTNAINQAYASWDGHLIALSASAGFQAYRASDICNRLMASADAAMYRMKSTRTARGAIGA